MKLAQLYQSFLNSKGVAIDTRNLTPGVIFFALQGEKQDGNRFAREAIDQGALAAVVNDPAIKDPKAFHVKDPLRTLQDLARYHRDHLNVPVIGITGSNGKTTSKELIGRVLETTFHSFATHGNLNNHIGLPLSVLSIKEEHELALLEFGADHPGENALLARISNPTHGLVTNIGLDHLEGFGDREGVFKGNKELIDHLAAQGRHAFFHIDDPDIQRMKESKLSSTSYGTHSSADLRGSLLQADPSLELEWQWQGDSENSSRFKTSLIGSYNLPNILAALCIGAYFGVKGHDMEGAIASYEPDNNRSQVIRTEKNQIVLDAYNANPTSMEAAIESFLDMESDPKSFILGDMLEMGPYEDEVHQRIVRILKDEELTDGLLVGKAFQRAAKGSDIQAVDTLEKAHERLQKDPFEERTLLIKGSRGLKLEELLKDL